jgi:hypothetical protein
MTGGILYKIFDRSYEIYIEGSDRRKNKKYIKIDYKKFGRCLKPTGAALLAELREWIDRDPYREIEQKKT